MRDWRHSTWSRQLAIVHLDSCPLRKRTRSESLTGVTLCCQKFSKSKRSIAINFGNYIKQLVKIGFSASLALGVVIALVLLITGETTAEIDLTFEFSALDGIWFLIGLPIIVTLVLLILSPLSFRIHRLLTRSQIDESQHDA